MAPYPHSKRCSTRSTRQIMVPGILVLVIIACQQDGLVSATFSIGATDSVTQQVGAAGASCVLSSVYEALYQGVPGHGVLLTQAQSPDNGSPVYERGTSLLEQDKDPVDILVNITDPTLDVSITNIPVFDEEGQTVVDNVTFQDTTLRQYGVVDLMGRAAGYTGENIKAMYFALGGTEEFYGFNYTQKHFSGRANDYTFSAQGNVVTNITVDTLADTFTEIAVRNNNSNSSNSNNESTCIDLAGMLYETIVAPFEATALADTVYQLAGDVRCFERLQAAAAGIFLHVDAQDGTEVVHIDIVQNDISKNGTEEVSPYDAFVKAYAAWREINPCPATGTATMHPTTGMDLAKPGTGMDNSGVIAIGKLQRGLGVLSLASWCISIMML